MSSVNPLGTTSHQQAAADAAATTRQSWGRKARKSRPRSSVFQARIDSEVLDVEPDIAALRERRMADFSDGRLGASTGMVNGLIGGIVFWVVAYAVFSVGKILF